MDKDCVSDRTRASRNLIELLTVLPADEGGLPASTCKDILSAIQALVPTLSTSSPIYATFHDGQVHDPLGGGSYAFQADIIKPTLLALVNDETVSNNDNRRRLEKQSNQMDVENHMDTNCESDMEAAILLLTRPIVIHAGAQPNNSPHAGTLAVFCYAFSLARRIHDQLRAEASKSSEYEPPPVSVEVAFVDTAPVQGHDIEIGCIQYQRSYRDVPEALELYMPDYMEVLRLLSAWSGISFTTIFQSDFFSQPTIPPLLNYIIDHHTILGRQLSPKYGRVALRAACPVPACGLTDKHGQLNIYSDVGSRRRGGQNSDSSAAITFHCPIHGPRTVRTSNPAEVSRLEANAPARNLVRSMSHLLDTRRHHVRVTGADYAGVYQETFLYRPLAAWSAATGLAPGRTPHILYAPLVVDWSGAKLSKSLYVCDGGYRAMELFDTDWLCSYARLRSQFGSRGEEGLRRLWEEVRGWAGDPRKLFRTFSVEYLHRVITGGRDKSV